MSPEHDTGTPHGGTRGRWAASSSSAHPRPAARSTSTTRRTLRSSVTACTAGSACQPVPTYVLWGEEMDSPRGRIYLMKEGLEGEPMTDAMVSALGRLPGLHGMRDGVPVRSAVRHADRADARAGRTTPRAPCQGQGAAWADLLAVPLPPGGSGCCAVRSGLPADGPRPAMRRTGLLERMAPQLAAMERLAPRLGQDACRCRRTSGPRASAGLSSACSPAVCRVPSSPASTPPPRGCCRPRAATSWCRRGRAAAVRCRCTTAARPRPRTSPVALVDTFEASAGRARRRQRGRLRLDDEGVRRPARRRPGVRRTRPGVRGAVRDVAEFLVELGPVAPRHPLEVTVAYHDACHLAHAQGVRAQPRRLLAGIPGLELREIAEPELCCGSAGIYNILNPEPARELGDRKAANIVATGAQVLVTANPGCLMQVAVRDRAVRSLDGHGAHRRGARCLDPGRPAFPAHPQRRLIDHVRVARRQVARRERRDRDAQQARRAGRCTPTFPSRFR